MGSQMRKNLSSKHCHIPLVKPVGSQSFRAILQVTKSKPICAAGRREPGPQHGYSGSPLIHGTRCTHVYTCFLCMFPTRLGKNDGVCQYHFLGTVCLTSLAARQNNFSFQLLKSAE